GVLADRPMAGGAHAAVGEDLRDRVPGGRALLALVGAREVGDVVGRVVVADVLQRGGDGFDQVVLADGRGHGVFPGADQCLAWLITRSARAMASALNRKATWMMVCHI